MNSHKSHSLVPLPFCGPFPRWLACLQLSFQPLPCLYYWSNRTWVSLGKPTCLILFSFFLDSHTNFSEAQDRLLPALTIPPHMPLNSPKCLSPITVTLLCVLWRELRQLVPAVLIFCLFSSLKNFCFYSHFPLSHTYWPPPQINKYVIVQYCH